MPARLFDVPATLELSLTASDDAGYWFCDSVSELLDFLNVLSCIPCPEVSLC